MKKKRFLKIYIEITNICNLNCSFCIKTKRDKKYMTITEFEEICKKIYTYTNLVALHVQGEPLIHLELDKFLNICEKYNLKVNITTNGILLKEKQGILLKSKAVRQINCSLHSAEQNGLLIDKYIDAILEVMDEIENKTNIFVSYRLWNLKKLEENSVNSKILERLEKHYNIKKLTKLAKEKEYIKLSNNIFLNQDIKFDWPKLSNTKISKYGKCYGLRNQIAILVNGDIVPCCLDAEGEIYLGNIFKEDIENILESEKVKKIILGFQKGKLEEELCKRCDFIKKF